MDDLRMWGYRPFVYYTLRNTKGEIIKKSLSLDELKDYRNTLENKSEYTLYEHIHG